MADQIAAINDQLRIDVDDFDLPELPTIPVGLPLGEASTPLIDSDMPFAEATQRLIDSKAYRLGGGS
jgi:hypothetical protein